MSCVENFLKINNRRFLLKRFPVCFNLFVLLFLVTPCLVVAVQPWMEWIPIKKKKITKWWNSLLFYILIPEIKSWSKNIGVDVVRSVCKHPGWMTELICCMLIHDVRKAKSYFGYAHGRIWLWPFRSWDSKICHVSRINRWIELIFCMLEVM